jgi:hypothetical protein
MRAQAAAHDPPLPVRDRLDLMVLRSSKRQAKKPKGSVFDGRCPNCDSTEIEPQMDCSTTTMYWCHMCWAAQRKPPIFEVAHTLDRT